MLYERCFLMINRLIQFLSRKNNIGTFHFDVETVSKRKKKGKY